MGKKTEQVTIGGTHFVIKNLGTNEGLRVYSQLAKAWGPVLRSKFDELVKAPGQSEENIALGFAGLAIEAIERLPTDQMFALAETFAATTQVKVGEVLLPMEGTQPGSVYDQTFEGRMALWTQWMIAHLSLNFADFLGAFQGFARKVAAAQTPSP